MNGSSWFIRAAIVGGITWGAVKFAPAGAPKMIALAIGSMAVASIVAGNIPLVANVLAGNLLPAPAASAA